MVLVAMVWFKDSRSRSSSAANYDIWPQFSVDSYYKNEINYLLWLARLPVSTEATCDSDCEQSLIFFANLLHEKPNHASGEPR